MLEVSNSGQEAGIDFTETYRSSQLAK